MRFEPDQLAGLAAVVRTGSFEAAARDLHVTSSAVSQRIKALENQAGQILVRRGQPATSTDAGDVLIRLSGQTELLEHEARAELLGDDSVTAIRVAIVVNADSLATWFMPVLPAVTARHDVVFDVHKEDEAVSASLLRDGTVMAAVTAEPKAVQGCNSVPIGAMRYIPMASRSYCERYVDTTPSLAAALAHAPMLNFNRVDTLQHKYLRRLTRRRIDPPTHYVPSSAAFTEAIRMGIGWGLVPEHDVRPDEEELADGLVRLDERHVDVPLFWQHWRLESTLLRTLTDEVTATARRALR